VEFEPTLVAVCVIWTSCTKDNTCIKYLEGKCFAGYQFFVQTPDKQDNYKTGLAEVSGSIFLCRHLHLQENYKTRLIMK